MQDSKSKRHVRFDEMGTILIVDDDEAIRKTLKRLFEFEGYGVEVTVDGRSALKANGELTFCAIVLDLGMPIVSRTDVFREIRRRSTAPIIVLSAVVDELDKVLLLELGADDYVTKPFSPRELLARVRGAIRRSLISRIQGRVEFGGVSVDFTRMTATLDGRPVELTPYEFKILEFLIRNSEQVVPREEIIRQVFGHEGEIHTRSIDNHILNLRQKLEREPARPAHIVTLRGLGYKFVA